MRPVARPIAKLCFDRLVLLMLLFDSNIFKSVCSAVWNGDGDGDGDGDDDDDDPHISPLTVPSHSSCFQQPPKVVSKSSMVGGLHTASGFKAALRNNFLCWMMLRTMRKVVATDPTARKPWEMSPRRFSRFFQQWGKKIHSICSQSAKV